MSKVISSLFSGAALLMMVWAGVCLSGVELIAPEVEVAEGDRRVDLKWRDPGAEDLVFINAPVLGTISFPWDGNATLSSDGFYLGACDWTFNVLVSIVLDSVEFSWQEVIDWRDKRVRGRRIVIADIEQFYDLSDGIRVKVDSAGLFQADTVGWNGPVPRFHGMYLGGTFTQADLPDSFHFTCTSGGELTDAGGGVGFEWDCSSENASGSFVVGSAGSTVNVFKGFKITFAAGPYTAGESFRVKVLVPVVHSDRFSVRSDTFEGYLVLRRSVEDRPNLYKVRANISKCDTFEFFQDENGDPDPYGYRYFTDEGIVQEQPGVTPDPDKPTLLNGFPYQYTVVTWDWSKTHQQVLSPISWELVYPSVAPVSDLGRIVVVPNPYIREAGWETGESKVLFMNIPGDASIRIYDATGGYVNTIHPNSYSFDHSEKQGSAQWNLKNANGDKVVSGIYIYRVESKSGEKMGRFIIVR
jgi:hypothetical protein